MMLFNSMDYQPEQKRKRKIKMVLGVVVVLLFATVIAILT